MGDDGGTWKREIRISSLHHPDSADSTDEAEDIDKTIGALESLKTVIRNTLLASLMVKPDKVEDVVEQYDELFKIVKPHNIVTTNYDNVLETYCELAKLDLVNGFKRPYLDDRRTWGDAWNGKETVPCLVKLHGSITWQTDDDGTVLEIARPGLRDTDRDVMISPTLGEKDYSHGIFPALWNRFQLTQN